MGNLDSNAAHDVIRRKLIKRVPKTNLWVFGYGSLMWNPEFQHTESQNARLYGYHRRLCLWSVRYRGTPKNPGLVVGMAKGGSCSGVAFKIKDEDIRKTVAYLYEREMISNAYKPVVKPVYLSDGRIAEALTFVSKVHHPQYANKMSIEKICQIVDTANGPRGSNAEYVINTAAHLDSIGIFNSEIHQVANKLKSV